MTAPAWDGSGLKGQRKVSGSQKDDMMVRRTGTSLRHTGSNPNQFLPVPFAKQQTVEEPARGPVPSDQRSEGCPVSCARFSSLSLACASTVSLTRRDVLMPRPTMLEAMK